MQCMVNLHWFFIWISFSYSCKVVGSEVRTYVISHGNDQVLKNVKAPITEANNLVHLQRSLKKKINI